jgi:hypothetical protein
MYLPPTLFLASGKTYFFDLSNFFIRYYSHLFKDKYLLRLFLTMKLPSQENNFVFLDILTPSSIIF